MSKRAIIHGSTALALMLLLGASCSQQPSAAQSQQMGQMQQYLQDQPTIAADNQKISSQQDYINCMSTPGNTTANCVNVGTTASH